MRMIRRTARHACRPPSLPSCALASLFAGGIPISCPYIPPASLVPCDKIASYCSELLRKARCSPPKKPLHSWVRVDCPYAHRFVFPSLARSYPHHKRKPSIFCSSYERSRGVPKEGDRNRPASPCLSHRSGKGSARILQGFKRRHPSEFPKVWRVPLRDRTKKKQMELPIVIS